MGFASVGSDYLCWPVTNVWGHFRRRRFSPSSVWVHLRDLSSVPPFDERSARFAFQCHPVALRQNRPKIPSTAENAKDIIAICDINELCDSEKTMSHLEELFFEILQSSSQKFDVCFESGHFEISSLFKIRVTLVHQVQALRHLFRATLKRTKHTLHDTITTHHVYDICSFTLYRPPWTTPCRRHPPHARAQERLPVEALDRDTCLPDAALARVVIVKTVGKKQDNSWNHV